MGVSLAASTSLQEEPLLSAVTQVFNKRAGFRLSYHGSGWNRHENPLAVAPVTVALCIGLAVARSKDSLGAKVRKGLQVPSDDKESIPSPPSIASIRAPLWDILLTPK